MLVAAMGSWGTILYPRRKPQIVESWAVYRESDQQKIPVVPLAFVKGRSCNVHYRSEARIWKMKDDNTMVFPGYTIFLCAGMQNEVEVEDEAIRLR
jgi:hypothetical protein